MFRKLLCGTAVLALTGHAALASQVIVNGQPYAAGGTHNVSYGHSAAGHNCCVTAPAVTTIAAPAVTYEAAPTITYQTAPASTYTAAPITYETIPATPITSYDAAPISYETIPAAPVTTYEAAPVTTYQPAPVTPVYQPVAPVKPAPVVMRDKKKKGWGSQVYVGARGGLSIAEDTDFVVGPNAINNDYDDGGYNIAYVVGWRNRVSPRLAYRLEAELGYQETEIDAHSTGGTRFDGTSFGDTETLYGFANLYLDVPVFGGLNGIVGGGVGVGQVEFDGHGVNDLGVVMDDEDTVFGYHLDAGVSYDINERLSLEAMYRYTSFVDVELEAVDGTTSETDVDSHNVLVGARYGF
jgi:opacity protein-like surface antigen